MEDKLLRYKKVATDFVGRVAHLESVLEIAVFASVAGGDPYPSDIDVAIFLNSLETMAPIAKAKRQADALMNGFDLFVFDQDRKFIGNVCQRKECGSGSGTAIRVCCTSTPFIARRDGLNFEPFRWFKTPVEILFHRDKKSILLSWQEAILQTMGLDSPEPYPIREPIVQKCRECGTRFTIDPGEQKYFEGMGFDFPKRCQSCRDDKNGYREEAF
jgi:hypothetical protein